MEQNQTTTPAPDSVATTATDEVFEQLAGDVPDLKIVAASSPGHQGEYDLNGKLLREWPVGSVGQPLVTQGPNDQVSSAAPELEKTDADAKPAAAPQGAAADETGTPAEVVPGAEKTGAPTPAETSAPADGAPSPVEDVAAAREAALRAPADFVQQPSQPPKATDPPGIDWSDEPDWSDGVKYPTEQDALNARRKYIADKAAENGLAIAEHSKRQAQAEANAAAQENIARAMQGRQIEYLRQAQASLGLNEEEFLARGQDFAMVRHPQAVNPAQAPNPVGQLLYHARDHFLMQRAQMGLPVGDHESVSEILSAQMGDLDFAKKVAAVAPDNPVGGLVVAAVAQVPAPVRMLKHLVSDDGQKQIKEIVDTYGDGRGMNAQTYQAAAQQVAHRIARIDAGLTDTPPAEKPKAAAPPAKQSPGPGRFTANVPGAPRSGAAPAHTSGAGGENEHEPFSQAWVDAEMRKAVASHAVQ